MKKTIIAAIVCGIGGFVAGVFAAPDIYALHAKKYFGDEDADMESEESLTGKGPEIDAGTADGKQADC